MKRLLTCIALFEFFFLHSLNAVSQTILEYDFVKKEFTEEIKSIENETQLKVKVKNINTILYDVAITVNQQTYHTKPPALFLQYFPTIDNIPAVMDQIGKAVQKTTADSGGIEIIAENIPSAELKKLNSLFRSELENNEELRKLFEKGDSVIKKEKKLGPKEQEYLGKYLHALKNKEKRLERSKYLKGILLEYEDYFVILNKRLVDISFLSATIKSPIVTPAVANDFVSNKGDLKNKIQSLFDELYKLESKYLQIDELYNGDSSIEILKIKKYKSFTDSIKKQIKISDIISLIQIADTAILSFICPPIKASGDDMEITITITPKDDSTSIIQSSLRGEIVKTNITVINKLELNFSTGIFGSMLVNKGFTAKPTYNLDTITSYSVKKENFGNFTLGPTALMHIAYRFSPKFALGGHIGIGIPITENSKPQYLTGISFLFGTKNRFCINASYAMGQVKRLSAATNMDENFSYKEKPTINLIDKWEGNLAFSITYNIFNP